MAAPRVTEAGTLGELTPLLCDIKEKLVPKLVKADVSAYPSTLVLLIHRAPAVLLCLGYTQCMVFRMMYMCLLIT